MRERKNGSDSNKNNVFKKQDEKMAEKCSKRRKSGIKSSSKPIEINVMVEKLPQINCYNSILFYLIYSIDFLPERSYSEATLSIVNSYCSFGFKILCGRPMSLHMGKIQK